MRAEDLQAVQTPLKERYREHPDAALITLRARGTIGDAVVCHVETGRAIVEAGLHPTVVIVTAFRGRRSTRQPPRNQDGTAVARPGSADRRRR